MLHLHFGTGRLGLGLVAPLFETPSSEVFLFNRSGSARNATGETALGASRRNDLLKNNTRHEYLIETPGVIVDADTEPRQRVQYHGFLPYLDSELEVLVEQVLSSSRERSKGIIVTASVITVNNYQPVVTALNVICREKERVGDGLGEIYLIACENTVSAHEIFETEEFADRIAGATRKHVRCVPALVDRVCVEIEECNFKGEPAVLVRAEEYGSIKLELGPQTDGLPTILEGSNVEFSRHLEIEKQIKLWLLNGSHWLIALTAFQESGGDVDLRLNDFINASEDHRLYVSEVVNEMRDGIEALLLSDPQYADFVAETNLSTYLDQQASLFLERFKTNDDTMTRILARFRTPSPEETTTVQNFVNRFLHKIEPPLVAYRLRNGTLAKSSTQGIFNLFRLQASGTYVDTGHHETVQAA